MMRAAVLLSLLLASLSIAAQNNSNGSVPTIATYPGGNVLVFLPEVVSCPISMQADQGVWDHTIRVRNGKNESVPAPSGQRISLSLKDSHPAAIVSATLRVRGLNGKNHMLETPVGTSKDGNATRTLHAHFVQENDGQVSTDLWLPGFTAVKSIELLDVTYADGSTWAKSGANRCRVQPNPLMLITGR